MATPLSRRDFTRLAVALPASLALAAPGNATAGGVIIGAITYSFHDLKRTPGQDTVDECIAALTYCNIGEIELMFNDVEPSGLSRTALQQWRIQTPASHFTEVRKKFNDAGINIYAYTVNYTDRFSDAEIEATLNHARYLGTDLIGCSCTISMAKRLAPFAEKHNIRIAFHGHTNVNDPNEFASPETFAAALAMSQNYRINLDIGHFVAAGFDPVPYIKQNHENITHLHIKDKKKNDGPNMHWGEGDTPVNEVLLLLKERRYPIAAFTEMSYTVEDPTKDEVKKNMDYMRKLLA